MKKILVLLISLCSLSLNMLYAQKDENICLSGMVMQFNTLKPVPYANVFVIHTKIGVIADQMGLFCIYVNKKDTVVFSSIGNRTTYYVVPDTLSKETYSIIQKVPTDTITLKMIEISSWPSLNQFNEAFTKEYGFDKEYEITQRNSSPLLNQIDYSKELNMKNYMDMHGDTYTSVYSNAHIPLNDVLNPARWSKLVKDWKSGKHR